MNNEIRNFNIINFKLNSDKPEYLILKEYEALKKNNKIFKIEYTKQTKPSFLIIDSSLYTLDRNSLDKARLIKITDLEFIETNDPDKINCYIHCIKGSGDDIPKIIFSEINSNDAIKLRQQIQNIKTLNIKLGTKIQGNSPALDLGITRLISNAEQPTTLGDTGKTDFQQIINSVLSSSDMEDKPNNILITKPETTNSYIKFKPNTNTESGESNASAQSFNSILPNRPAMHKITVNDIKRTGYFVAESNVPASSASNLAPVEVKPVPTAPEVSDFGIKPNTSDLTLPYDKKPDGSLKSKNQSTTEKKPYKKLSKNGKPNGYEIFLTELLPFIGTIALAFIVVTGMTVASPIVANGIFILGGTMFLFNKGMVHGGKNVFRISGQAFGQSYKYMNRSYKNYSTYREVQKKRKLETEIDLQNQYKNELEIETETITNRNTRLQKRFLTDEEKVDDTLSEEEKQTRAMTRFYEYMDRKHPLKLPKDRPREVLPFRDTVIPKSSLESANTFASDPDLNLDADMNKGKSDKSKVSTINIEGIHSGQGSLIHSSDLNKSQTLQSELENKQTLKKKGLEKSVNPKENEREL